MLAFFFECAPWLRTRRYRLSRLEASTDTGFADGGGISRLTIADLNGDGIPDAVIDGNGFVSIASVPTDPPALRS